MSQFSDYLLVKYKISLAKDDDEPSPDTLRDPPRVNIGLPTQQIQTFLNMLYEMALFKNLLIQLKDKLDPSIGLLIKSLISLRPGTLRNAIKTSLEQNDLTEKEFVDYRNDFMKSLISMHMDKQMAACWQLFEMAYKSNRINIIETNALLTKIRELYTAIKAMNW